MRNEMLFAALMTLAPLTALAHVTLTEASALPGAHYVAHFRVGHGCDGAAPPPASASPFRPADMSDVEPQAPAGWSVATVRMDGGQHQLPSPSKAAGWTPRPTGREFRGRRCACPRKTGVMLVFRRHPDSCGNGNECWAEMPVPGEEVHPSGAGTHYRRRGAPQPSKVMDSKVASAGWSCRMAACWPVAI